MSGNSTAGSVSQNHLLSNLSLLNKQQQQQQLNSLNSNINKFINPHDNNNKHYLSYKPSLTDRPNTATQQSTSSFRSTASPLIATTPSEQHLHLSFQSPNSILFSLVKPKERGNNNPTEAGNANKFSRVIEQTSSSYKGNTQNQQSTSNVHPQQQNRLSTSTIITSTAITQEQRQYKEQLQHQQQQQQGRILAQSTLQHISNSSYNAQTRSATNFTPNKHIDSAVSSPPTNIDALSHPPPPTKTIQVDRSLENSLERTRSPTSNQLASYASTTNVPQPPITSAAQIGTTTATKKKKIDNSMITATNQEILNKLKQLSTAAQKHSNHNTNPMRSSAINFHTATQQPTPVTATTAAMKQSKTMTQNNSNNQNNQFKQILSQSIPNSSSSSSALSSSNQPTPSLKRNTTPTGAPTSKLVDMFTGRVASQHMPSLNTKPTPVRTPTGPTNQSQIIKQFESQISSLQSVPSLQDQVYNSRTPTSKPQMNQSAIISSLATQKLSKSPINSKKIQPGFASKQFNNLNHINNNNNNNLQAANPTASQTNLLKQQLNRAFASQNTQVSIPSNISTPAEPAQWPMSTSSQKSIQMTKQLHSQDEVSLNKYTSNTPAMIPIISTSEYQLQQKKPHHHSKNTTMNTNNVSSSNNQHLFASGSSNYSESLSNDFAKAEAATVTSSSISPHPSRFLSTFSMNKPSDSDQINIQGQQQQQPNFLKQQQHSTQQQQQFQPAQKQQGGGRSQPSPTINSTSSQNSAAPNESGSTTPRKTNKSMPLQTLPNTKPKEPQQQQPSQQATTTSATVNTQQIFDSQSQLEQEINQLRLQQLHFKLLQQQQQQQLQYNDSLSQESLLEPLSNRSNLTNIQHFHQNHHEDLYAPAQAQFPQVYNDIDDFYAHQQNAPYYADFSGELDAANQNQFLHPALQQQQHHTFNYLSQQSQQQMPQPLVPQGFQPTPYQQMSMQIQQQLLQQQFGNQQQHQHQQQMSQQFSQQQQQQQPQQSPQFASSLMPSSAPSFQLQQNQQISQQQQLPVQSNQMKAQLTQQQPKFLSMQQQQLAQQPAQAPSSQHKESPSITSPILPDQSALPLATDEEIAAISNISIQVENCLFEMLQSREFQHQSTQLLAYQSLLSDLIVLQRLPVPKSSMKEIQRAINMQIVLMQIIIYEHVVVFKQLRESVRGSVQHNENLQNILNSFQFVHSSFILILIIFAQTLPAKTQQIHDLVTQRTRKRKMGFLIKNADKIGTLKKFNDILQPLILIMIEGQIELVEEYQGPHSLYEDLYQIQENIPNLPISQIIDFSLSLSSDYIQAMKEELNRLQILCERQSITKSLESEFVHQDDSDMMHEPNNSVSKYEESVHHEVSQQQLLSTVPPPYLKDSPKKPYTLVLDLDETLVHYQELDEGGKFLVRPCAERFLEEMGQYYEIIIFTAALQDYADFILDIIDSKKNIAHRFYRQHTITHENSYYKDLSRIGRDINKTIIIDNLAENFKLQPENGIQIQSWYGEADDRALLELTPLLKQIVVKNFKSVQAAFQQFREKTIVNLQNGVNDPHLNLSLDVEEGAEDDAVHQLSVCEANIEQ